MIFSSASIIALIEHYGYTIIFPISVIEGPVITVIGGFLASLGHLNAYIAFLVLLFGDIVGDIMYYLMGRWGGKPFVRRWGKYFYLNEKNVGRMAEYFETKGFGQILLSKTHAAGSAVLFAAGLGGMSLGRFAWYSFWASIPKTLALELVGYYGGASFEVVNKYLNTGAAVTTVIAVFGTAYWIHRKIQKNSELPIQ